MATAAVSFQWKNPDFLFKNPDFLFLNSDFLLKNVDFIIQQARSSLKPGAYYHTMPACTTVAAARRSASFDCFTAVFRLFYDCFETVFSQLT